MRDLIERLEEAKGKTVKLKTDQAQVAKISGFPGEQKPKMVSLPAGTELVLIHDFGSWMLVSKRGLEKYAFAVDAKDVEKV